MLRDILGINGPKYGCGINVCKACTSHLNGKAINPCAIPVRELRPTDEVTTIEGPAATAAADLHPVQRAWLDLDTDLVAEMMVRISASFPATPSQVIDLDDDAQLAAVARQFLVPMLHPATVPTRPSRRPTRSGR